MQKNTPTHLTAHDRNIICIWRTQTAAFAELIGRNADHNGHRDIVILNRLITIHLYG